MTYPHRLHPLALALLLVAPTACAPPSGEAPAERAEVDAAQPLAGSSLVGSWRAVLASPGGPLPFTLRIEADGSAVMDNGEEETPVGAIETRGAEVVLHFDWYDSEITAELDGDAARLEGRWRKTVPEGDSVLPFSAVKADPRRFLSIAEAGLDPAPGAAEQPSIDGVWSVVFTEVLDDPAAQAEVEPEQAQGEFIQGENGRVDGTFLTPTGDYRYLEGSYEDGILRLSTFDGAHAFLFVARVQENGTLAGDFWSRDSYHAAWTAERTAGDARLLPDAWEMVGLTNDAGRFDFDFPDLDGQSVSLDDPRFEGKVVLVNIFGSWCPNCNDEAPLLGAWAREYRDQGLEVVGLAYEFSGDPERDGRQVRRFAERHNLDYTLLLAGTSDKADAAATLPDLEKVLAYPTSLFLDRDGKVRRIYSGFAGPGTGEHHEELVAELEGLIEELLTER